jgi:hypothetical protein
MFVAIFLTVFRRATSHYLQLTKLRFAFHCRNRCIDVSWSGLSYIVKQIYRNKETDEVLNHFRLHFGLILVFCNNKTLIVQQILGNTNRLIKGHDITSLHSTNIFAGNISRSNIIQYFPIFWSQL